MLTINEIQKILQSKELLNSKIIEDIAAITTFADSRRTININLKIDENSDMPIEEKKIVVMISNNGLIVVKILKVSTSRRAVAKVVLSNLETMILLLKYFAYANTEQLLLLSSLGKSYTLALGNVPIGQEIYLTQFFEIGITERILKIISYSDLTKYTDVVILTRKGLIKRSDIKEYQSRNKKGLVGIKLKRPDSVAAVLVGAEADEIMLATKDGYGLRLPNRRNFSKPVALQWGLKPLTFENSDEIVGGVILSKDNNMNGIASITSDGKAKYSAIDDFYFWFTQPKGTHHS